MGEASRRRGRSTFRRKYKQLRLFKEQTKRALSLSSRLAPLHRGARWKGQDLKVVCVVEKTVQAKLDSLHPSSYIFQEIFLLCCCWEMDYSSKHYTTTGCYSCATTPHI